MENQPGNTPQPHLPPPDWYPDPQGSGRLRWWSGTAWTEYLSAPPPGAPFAGTPFAGAPQLATRPERPQLGAEAKIYGPWIWIVTVLPLVAVLTQLAWNPRLRLMELRGGAGRTIDPLSLFTPGYFLLLAVGAAVYAAIVILAYLDRQYLLRVGVVRPFHWAWAFLGPAVYVIGRSVVVHKVAPGRGLSPIWLLIAVAIVGFVVGGIHTAYLVGDMQQLMTGYY